MHLTVLGVCLLVLIKKGAEGPWVKVGGQAQPFRSVAIGSRPGGSCSGLQLRTPGPEDLCRAGPRMAEFRSSLTLETLCDVWHMVHTQERLAEGSFISCMAFVTVAALAEHH